MNAYVGHQMRCPVCGRLHSAIGLRTGDAWVTCWHRKCGAVAWVVRVPAVEPVPRDVELAVGARLAAALLLTYAPAPLIAIAVPGAVAATLGSASRVVVVNRLTAVLCGTLEPIAAAERPAA